MVDPKFRNFSNYKNITLFKPNLKELLKGLKIEAQKTDIDILIESGQEFRKKQKQEILLLTLSEKGMLVLKEGAHYYIPAFQRDIIDVSGAGDTVIAVTAVAYAGGMNAPQLATLSNLAGGLVCEKSGVVPIERELLEKECERMTDY
ncbi:MAG TPA: PfkB family carbohydrate kinase [Bacteroidales bacterium]|nr:PfkB family carbohydrate kinase [Bacteroidales bacterium]